MSNNQQGHNSIKGQICLFRYDFTSHLIYVVYGLNVWIQVFFNTYNK